MALSTSYFAPANWFGTGATRTVTGVSWSTGDIVVVFGAGEDNGSTLGVPTNANLTFTQRAVTTATASQCMAYIWTSAAAASGQTAQTITSTPGNTAKVANMGVVVVSGSPTGQTGAVANFLTTAPSLAVASGDVAVMFLADWNATNPPNKTPLAGSGTAVERNDSGNTTNYAIWGATWTGTAAGTFSFGPSDYTSLKPSQTAIVIQAPATKSMPIFRRPFAQLSGR